jgi:predicted porin
MRKSLIALAVLGACASSAYADDTLTLYGILDAGIFTLDHSPNFNGNEGNQSSPYGQSASLGATSRATGFTSGGETMSRWGIRGSEDMGNGMKAFFQLESGINIGSGNVVSPSLPGTVRTGASGALDSSLEGQLFGRGAFLGLSGDWGSLSGGRTTSLFLDLIPNYDPVNFAQFSPINYSGTYGGGGATDNARIDNSLKYVAKWGDFNVGLSHKFGGIAGSATAGQVNEAVGGWDNGTFGLQVGYQGFQDTTSLNNNGVGCPGAACAPYAGGAVGATFENTKAEMVAGRWNINSAWTLKAGYEHYVISNPSNPSVDVTTTSIYGLPLSGVPSVAPLAAASGTPDKIFNVYWIGGNWVISGPWKLSAGYYYIHQNDFSGGLTSSPKYLADLAGTSKFYSLALNYYFSKRTDGWAGIMFNKEAGGVAAGVNGTGLGPAYNTGITSWTAIGFGLRTIF